MTNPTPSIVLLSAAKRRRGRAPLRSNGKVRWCFLQTRCVGRSHRGPPPPPALRAAPSLSPRDDAGGEGFRGEIWVGRRAACSAILVTGEDVARAAHRQDAARLLGIVLDGGADARDMDVDRAVEGFELLTLEQVHQRVA